MKPALRLFGRAFRISLASRAAYRGDFLLTLIITLLLESVTPLVTVLIYRSGSSFPGWTLGEALLLQGIFLLARGVASPVFFGMVWTVFEQVREGTFELTLLKPRSPLLTTLAQSIDLAGIGQFLGGAALLAVALHRVPAPGPARTLLFLGLFGLSVLVFFAFALFMAASLFVWVGNGRVFEVLDSVLLFAQVPGSIYPRSLQVIFAAVLPVGAIAFFPARALLGRLDPLAGVAAAAAVVFFLVALLSWRAALRRYSGGGG